MNASSSSYPTYFALAALSSLARLIRYARIAAAALRSSTEPIVRLMGHGLSNKTIARQLSIAPETVKSYAKSIFWKLAVRSRAEAVYRAAAFGLI
jgi:DNA-binding NarL/FixJ family response regulator